MRCRTGPLKALPLPRRAEPDVWITVLDIADIPRAFGEINGIAVAVLREIASVDVSEGFHPHAIAAHPAPPFHRPPLPPPPPPPLPPPPRHPPTHPPPTPPPHPPPPPPPPPPTPPHPPPPHPTPPHPPPPPPPP